MIYATTRLEADIRLRAHINGNMRGRLYQDGRWMLPISPDPKDGCNRDELIKQSRYCFKAGKPPFKVYLLGLTLSDYGSGIGKPFQYFESTKKQHSKLQSGGTLRVS